MLKKALFAIAVVGLLAVVASAGELKVHDWDTTTATETITETRTIVTPVQEHLATLDIIMDIPYFVSLHPQDPIEVFQVKKEIHHWAGNSGWRDLCSNFALIIKVEADVECADGEEATIVVKSSGLDPAPSAEVDPCCHKVKIFVDIPDLDIKCVSDKTGQNAGQDDVTIGVVRVCVTAKL